MSDATSFFALIIGINTYGDEQLNLSCAVKDAKRMHSILTEKFQVPANNIVLLLDEKATRDDIISKFETHLITNLRIQKQDPILIFFAGHGTSGFRERDGEDGERGTYEAICPANRFIDLVPDIEDRHLGFLLSKLAEAKGNNVTVIMDCCHSGSGTRSAYVDGQKVRDRYAPPLRHTRLISSIPELTKREDSRHVQQRAGFKHPDLSSHVLLAACRSDEKAYEWNDSGWFTFNLLELLRDKSLPRTSYRNLISKIGMWRHSSDERDEEGKEVVLTQTPQCEGKRKDSLLFGGGGLGVDKRLVSLKKEGERHRVDAGSIHGVTPGTRFTIQVGNLFSLEPLGQAVATSVQAVWSYLELSTSFSIPSSEACYARISYWISPTFNIGFRTHDGSLSKRLDVMKASLGMLTGIDRQDIDVNLACAEVDKARIVVTVHIDKMELDHKGPLIAQNCDVTGRVANVRLRNTSKEAGLVDLQQVCGAARFDLHLHLENPDHPYRNHITAKLHRIYDKNNVEENVDHIVNGCAQFKHNKRAKYVLSLQNNSGVDLFAAVYYFDVTNQSIKEFYKAPSHSQPPLLRNSEPLRVGCQSSGVKPFFFFLSNGEDRDTGFLKVYLSDRYAELGMIEQEDNFTPCRENGDTGRSSNGPDIPEEPGTWDTMTIVVHVER